MRSLLPLVAVACAGCFDFASLRVPASGASHCDALGTTVYFCDGFEAAAIDTTRWQIQIDEPTTGSIVSDSTRAARGAHAAHYGAPMTAISGQDYAHLVLSGDHIGVPNPSVHARVFVWVSAAIAGNGADLFDVYTDQPFGAIKLGMVSGGFVGVELDSIVPSTMSGSYVSKMHLPTDRWTCLEIGFDVIDAAASVHISIDDEELTDLAQSSLAAAVPTAVDLNFQSAFTDTIPALDVWYDELVIDGGPIGCAK